MKKRIIFRVEGSSSIGYGHIYRVFALAEMLCYNFNCIIATSYSDSTIDNLNKNLKLQVLKLSNKKYNLKINKIKNLPFDMENIIVSEDIVVLDGYWFDYDYQLEVKKIGAYLISIDDLGGQFASDVIINHAPNINKTKYIVPSSTQLCLGLDYLLLRKEFFEVPVKYFEQADKILYLSFGGSDIYGYTYKVLLLLVKIKIIHLIHVVITDAFSDVLLKKLHNLQEKYTSKIILHKNINALQIINILDSCTYAITSASTVALEVIARGIKPMLVMYADNQKNIHDGLIQEKLGYAIKSFNMVIAFSYILYFLCKQIRFGILKNYLQQNQYFVPRFNYSQLLRVFDI